MAHRGAVEPIHLPAQRGRYAEAEGTVHGSPAEWGHSPGHPAVSGEPVRGVQVQFYTDGGRLLGAAYTNHSGIAAISASENLGPGTAQELLAGYDAVLLGDDVHAPASAHR